jgi:four helix bundle protein
MSTGGSRAVYDLEERTILFAQRLRKIVLQVPRALGNTEDCKQLVRASGSVGANYIEANESLSHRDFRARIRISRTEAKENHHGLGLIDLEKKPGLEPERQALVQESEELTLIFGPISRKSSK